MLSSTGREKGNCHGRNCYQLSMADFVVSDLHTIEADLMGNSATCFMSPRHVVSRIDCVRIRETGGDYGYAHGRSHTGDDRRRFCA